MFNANGRQILVILTHAFVGWALCAGTMAIGPAVTTLQNALIVHAIAVPIFFFGVSMIYFSRFDYTTPLQTAVIFVGFMMLVDFFLVALVINKSLEMFTSRLGTWVPFALIFASTYLTGLYVVKRPRHSVVAHQ